MEHKISHLFYAKNSRKTKQNLTPIYIRITINGRRFEQSINRGIEISEWSKTTGTMIGKTASAKIINAYLDAIRARVYDIEREFIFAGEGFTYESFKKKWTGITENPRMILELFQEHNDQVHELIGKDYAPMTLIRQMYPVSVWFLNL